MTRQRPEPRDAEALQAALRAMYRRLQTQALPDTLRAIARQLRAAEDRAA